MNDQTQPQNNDVVLGGRMPPLHQGVVLGGLDGLKQQLASHIVDVKLAAITQASQHGEAGLELLVQVLKQETSRQIRWAAYSVLSCRTELEIKNAISEHSPYRFFRLLFTLEGSYVQGTGSYSHIFVISPDSQHLVTHSLNETLKVWDLKTGKLLNSFQGIRQGLSFGGAMTIYPDGQNCCVGYSDHRIEIKDLKTGHTTKTLKGKASDTTAIAIS
ncbi:hypothetical protein H6F90_14690 [Trichocoleus sp. FACHB-591]|uniref:GUN4 N-terminal ARM-like repeat domain-containing protein n=1 Tax=Trichocoleus sp. FACHB-591 TaxID=2692872 RepID=UPI0016879EBE|nr:GUN4 N-terminal ARM-like repeat domain-containing protein [Trichocoleus sp. FACHB-591]MBD2096386.1 hypothetical protein [Trichocoleus sp. FACHB-591]